MPMVILRRKAHKGRIHQDHEQKLRVNAETKVKSKGQKLLMVGEKKKTTEEIQMRAPLVQ